MLGAELAGMVNREEAGNKIVGKVTLPRDGKGGGLDGGEDFGASFPIELMPIEAKEDAFPDGLDCGLWILPLDGRLHDGACGVPHGTAHNEPLFAGPLHQQGAVARRYLRWSIAHIHTVRNTGPF